MEHTEAIDTGAAERYALGEMGENERDRYEEHFFDCPDCAAEVKAVAVFLENAKAVVREDGAPAEEEDPQRVAAWPADRAVVAPARRRGGWQALFWPMPLGAAAALVMLLGGPAAYLALYRLPEMERTIAAERALQPAASYFLTVSRSEPPEVKVGEHERAVLLTLSKSSRQSFPFYRCEVMDANGRLVTSNMVPGPQADELQILLHVEKLQPGRYVVAVTGLESASAAATPPPVEYHFTLRRDDE